MMSFSRIAVAAAVALSMTGAPVLAQSAAPLSVAAHGAASLSVVDRSGAPVEHASNLRRDYMFALGFFAVVIAAILLIGSKNGHNLPASA
jgi:hypothetical protein